MLLRTMLQNPHTHAALPEVLEKLPGAAAFDFDQAHPIPAAVDHSLAVHDLEQQVLFQQEWICVGRKLDVIWPDGEGNAVNFSTVMCLS